LLSKPFPFTIKLAHISLAFVGLMWVLPFLNYHHAYPITTFYQEWSAALLGLCAMPLLVTARFWQTPAVPRSVLLPLGLMTLLLVQFLIGMVIHFDRLMLIAMYFLFAALLMMLGRQLREELGLPTVVTVLSLFLLVGAELNMLAGLIQHYRWNTFLNPYVTAKTAYAVYGNTAQPNHFADYMALGMISLGLLHVRFGLRLWQSALLAAPMLFVMVLSGSRSPWLYLSFAVALAWLWQRRDGTKRPLLHFGIMLLAGFVVMHGVAEIPWLEGVSGGITSAERLFSDNASGRIRLHLWKEAALIFTQHPLLGTGFGQFAYQHMLLAADLRNPAVNGLYNNAHDLVMQLAAEGGLAALAVLLGTLGMWIWHSVVRGAAFTIYHWWGYAALAVLGIHSLLEYPLWYAYFIAIAALLLGLFDGAEYRLELRTTGRLAVLAILVMGVVLLVQTRTGYLKLGTALSLQGRSNAVKVQEALMAAHEYPLLSSYSELFIASAMETSEEHLQEKLALNERALRYIPIAPVVYHQAWLLAWSGNGAEAERQLERAIWSYPGHYRLAVEELAALARKDPARFSTLLEFANRKYEEYRSVAVPAK
jgi:O-antigen ligase